MTGLPAWLDVDALAAVDTRDEAWRGQAACFGMDLALFFQETQHIHPDVKAACARCPVKLECLAACLAAEAVTVGDRYGNYAGTRRADRHRIARVLRERRLKVAS